MCLLSSPHCATLESDRVGDLTVSLLHCVCGSSALNLEKVCVEYLMSRQRKEAERQDKVSSKRETTRRVYCCGS